MYIMRIFIIFLIFITFYFFIHMLDILVASSSIFRQFSERKEIRSLNTRNREMVAFQAY